MQPVELASTSRRAHNTASCEITRRGVGRGPMNDCRSFTQVHVRDATSRGDIRASLRSRCLLADLWVAH